MLSKLVDMLKAFFGWRESTSDRKTVVDKDARKVFDLANATIAKEKAELKKANYDIRTYKKEAKLAKMKERDTERAAAALLGISLKRYRKLNRQMKQHILEENDS